MPNWLKTAGKWGGIFVVSVLAILTVTLFVNPDFGSGFAVQSESGWGTIFAILTLIITLLKQVIAFIGFLTTAIKVLVFLVFAAIFLFVGMLVLRTWNSNRSKKE
ncbi:MAG: hypothetical protein ACR2MD_14455 [Aridibacter sp.]